MRYFHETCKSESLGDRDATRSPYSSGIRALIFDAGLGLFICSDLYGIFRADVPAGLKYSREFRFDKHRLDE